MAGLTDTFERVDPRFTALVFGTAHLDKLHTGCRWAEGPAWFAAGRCVAWSDIPNDRVLRWDETDGSVSVFQQPAMNSNDHTVDRQGPLISCEHRGRCVSRTGFDGQREVLAERHDGKRFNSPNDVVVKSDGSIWFTDPSYGIDSDYEGDAAHSELGACNVYRIDPDSGRVTIVADDFVLGKVRVPETAAKVCFGGPKLNRLFICATTSLYSNDLNTRAAPTSQP
jgi:gluconolactonase